MSNTPVEITTKNTVALTLGIIATVVGVFALLVGWVSGVTETGQGGSLQNRPL